MLTIHLLATAAAQSTFEVGQDPMFPTIQSALQEASDGDVIRIHAGMGGDQGAYTETLLVQGLEVILEGVGGPTIQAESSFNGFLHVTGGGDVTVSGITFEGQGSHRLARISGGATLTLTDSTVRDTSNGDTGGGSVLVSSGALIVEGTTFSSSRVYNSERRGGMIATEGPSTLEVHGSIFTDGRSEHGDGGAI
ncbi:MAG TPA: hypothetical protein ENK18_18840, partial [Deltaproteobacteria bacterium]|nr:hypothetical protein [Deltaproteobacteria bacterium]